jgi:hypothetical protein
MSKIILWILVRIPAFKTAKMIWEFFESKYKSCARELPALLFTYLVSDTTVLQFYTKTKEQRASQ